MAEPIPLIVRRTIRAPRKQIFQSFSRSDLLSQWFTPTAEIALDILEFVFAPGARFRLRYTMPDGRQPVVGGVYESIDEPEQIVMSWIWEEPDPLADIPMRVTFRFIEQAGATDVIITHEHLPSDQACTIHADGWEASLDRLEQFLAAGVKTESNRSPGQ